MSLLGLANELLLQIAEEMDADICVNRLSRTCKRLYSLLNLFSYQLNSRSKDKRSALGYAIQHNRIEMARRALSQQPNCNDTIIGYHPLIIFAARAGNPEIMQLILEQPNIKIDVQDSRNETPLLVAARAGNVNMVRLLLSHGANYNYTRPYYNMWLGSSPLCAAIYAKSVESVRVLLECHDINVHGGANSEFPLVVASIVGNVEILRLLAAKPRIDVNIRNNINRTPLHYAAENCKEGAVRFLLTLDGIDPDCVDDLGRSPLFMAAGKKSEVIVKMLLDQDVDVNREARALYGTPLFAAAMTGAHNVMSLLLSKGGRFFVHENWNPLSQIIAAQRSKAAVMLLEKDWIDVHYRDRRGNTPLIEAAYHGDVAFLEELLKRDDINAGIKTNLGETLLHVAAKRVGWSTRCKDVFRMLLPRGDVCVDAVDDDGRTPLMEVIKVRWTAMALELIEKYNVRVEVADSDGCTPLYFASSAGDEKIVQTLLARKEVKVNIRAKSTGLTPLIVAAKENRRYVMWFLLQRRDIDIMAADTYGRTAFWWAARHGLHDALKIMLGRGADPGKHDLRGTTPLMRAVVEGHEHIVKILLGCPNCMLYKVDRKGRDALKLANLVRNTKLENVLNEAVTFEMKKEDEDKKEVEKLEQIQNMSGTEGRQIEWGGERVHKGRKEQDHKEDEECEKIKKDENGKIKTDEALQMLVEALEPYSVPGSGFWL